jgi:uncharacterized alkaline shock family protein YloU
LRYSRGKHAAKFLKKVAAIVAVKVAAIVAIKVAAIVVAIVTVTARQTRGKLSQQTSIPVVVGPPQYMHR